MRVLIAGATGAIGRPLLRYVTEAGHHAIALVRSSKAIFTRDVEEVIADVLDPKSVSDAVQQAKPDIIINQLTSLPKHYTSEEMKRAAVRDKQLRVEGNANL